MYAVEFSHRSGRDLINVAKKRTNIIPIIEDARHPHKYRMLVGKLVGCGRELLCSDNHSGLPRDILRGCVLGRVDKQIKAFKLHLLHHQRELLTEGP